MMNFHLPQAKLLYFLTFALSLAISLLLTPLCRFIAIRRGILDCPSTAVKTHRVPTPYLGGIAVWAGWALSLFFIRFFTHFPTGTLRSLRGILFGSILILLLGLADDAIPKGLGFKKKFLFQAIAASLILYFDIRLHFISSTQIAVIFSIFWVMGITNSFNIIDVMDGLSSGIAAIASLAFFFIAMPSEDIYVNFCAVALAGGCLGFLPYNLSKSRKIFMGDTGSLTIGFILAAIAMGTSYSRISFVGVFAPLLILAIPMYDTFLVSILRMRKGKSPFLGSKDHFALRLEKLGFTRGQILVITYAASAVLAFCAWLVTRLPTFDALILVLSCIIAGLVIGWFLSKVKID